MDTHTDLDLNSTHVNTHANTDDTVHLTAASTEAVVNDTSEPSPKMAEIVQISVSADEAASIKATQEKVAAAKDRIAKLSAQRQTWQDTVYKTSNDMLYAILQDCYRLYDDMLGTSLTASALRTALDRTLTERKISFESSTHTMTKIVRCVFDGDRRRINAYSLALRAAINNKPKKVPVDELAKFIAENGGVEELRIQKSPTSMSTVAKVDLAKTDLAQRNYAVVSSIQLVEGLDAAKVGQQHVLIVTQQADGTLVVNGIASTDSAVNAALSAYYSANKTHISAAASGETEAKKQSGEANLINALVEKAVA